MVKFTVILVLDVSLKEAWQTASSAAYMKVQDMLK